jgi:hypothetical protein
LFAGFLRRDENIGGLVAIGFGHHGRERLLLTGLMKVSAG